jgi:ABC-type uncharacterized transport system substrate-binding protein
MRTLRLTILLLLVLSTSQLFARNATAAQYLYMISKVIPEKKKVAVFMSRDLVEKEKGKLQRAAATFGVTVTIYVIEGARSIGTSLKKLSGDDVLVVYETSVLVQKSSKMFILSKCKEKGIPVVSPSEEYAKAGAFIGIFVNEKFKMTGLIINLQNHADLAPKFTEEFNVSLGITEVLK